MQTTAIVLDAPETLAIRDLPLQEVGVDDVVVDVRASAISTGTERLLWSGRMPPFPGMGYPLVPGYEAVGEVVEAGDAARHRVGESVFIPGSTGFVGARGLFGAAASRLVAPSARVHAVPAELGERGVLIALAATAHHAVAAGSVLPDLIVGHGVLGRLLARVTIALGANPPLVWETSPTRRGGAEGYAVTRPDAESGGGFRCAIDASGDPAILDTLIARLARGGEVVLAGFYDRPLSFAFPPAFMREARIRVAAEWTPGDLTAVIEMIVDGRLSLDGLITHAQPAASAAQAYRTAFEDPECLKMVIDWRMAA